VNDLPDFMDYKMENRTYRYFRGEPLYPFGYGLSYTTFKYSKIKVAKNVKSGEPLKVTVKVKNTGKMAGDEVAQLYISNLKAAVPVPIKALKGFKRIHLNPGESKVVTFEIAPEAFSIIDENFKRVIRPGDFMIQVGGRQPAGKTSEQETGILKKAVSVI
jgi:beta-glucosidase